MDKERAAFDAVASHPLQSWAWGEFKEKTGVEVVRMALFDGPKITRGFQMTVHTVPKFNWRVGYYPKGSASDEAEIAAVKTAAEKHNLVFVKMEPNFYDTAGQPSPKIDQARRLLEQYECHPGKAQFTPHTFIVDLRQTEEELFAGLKSKTRYNVNLAIKHDVQVVVDDSPEAFEEYISLWKKTTARQKFYAHDEVYQREMWKAMSASGIGHLLRATYKGETLGVWIVFVFNHVLYYPYGASSRKHREVMANNLLAWEAIKFGKQMNCHTFDMWGSLGLDADQKDSWYGFHKFKQGYGGTLVESVGTYDYISDMNKYKLFKILEVWRWRYLRFRSKLPF